MKAHLIRKYIKLMEQEGINQVLLLLLEYSQPDIHRNSHMVTLEEFTKHLQSQLPVDDKGSKQVDIVDAIEKNKRGEY